MFSFVLPKFASLPVQLPGGQSLLLVHVGDGRFLTRIPPVVIAGVAPTEGIVEEGLPITWDGETMPANGPGYPAVFAFDPETMGAALEGAAAAGDATAIELLASMRAAEAEIAASAGPDAPGILVPDRPSIILPPGVA